MPKSLFKNLLSKQNFHPAPFFTKKFSYITVVNYCFVSIKNNCFVKEGAGWEFLAGMKFLNRL
ncbi:hypothetical protein KKG37_02210, partial [Patescibacteria group bacterium]|nr:hypothetical protein [Patescibacteria group bacterium]